MYHQVAAVCTASLQETISSQRNSNNSRTQRQRTRRPSFVPLLDATKLSHAHTIYGRIKGLIRMNVRFCAKCVAKRLLDNMIGNDTKRYIPASKRMRVLDATRNSLAWMR
jgi:hypothetical protein